MLAAKCYECHNADKMKGDVDLKKFAANPDVPANFEIWNTVKDTIDNGDMPPRKAKQLTSEEKAGITGWVQQSLDVLAEAKSGDPGPVTMRRLTNAEYDYTIRDLTGRDYSLAKEFQTDGGGGEGFTNTGDVLFMSPSAIDKYFAAARKLADFASIMPGTGIVFHPQRIGLRGPEQVKAQAQQGLYVWYQQKAAPHLPKDDQPMREGDYMLACWKHKHAKTPLDQLAKDMKLSIHFLSNWWNLVNSVEPKSRFLDLVRVPWRELPADEKTALERIKAIEADRLSWNNPKHPGSGVQRQQQDADGIRPYNMQTSVKDKPRIQLCIGDTGDGNKGDIALVTYIEVSIGKKKENYFHWLNRTLEESRKQAAANPPPPNLDALKARIAELEKIRAVYGKHPQPGRQIEPHVIALAAPTVLTLPMPESAHWLKIEARLDMQNPEVDEATIQWAIATDKPRDVTKIMPGVLTIWKRSTKKSGETMNDFNKMKTAFPDMFERRLEEVANNLYRGGKPNYTVYYFSDDQLGSLLGEKDKRFLDYLKKDWGYTATGGKLNPQQQQEYNSLMVGHLHYFASLAWRRPLTGEDNRKLDSLYYDGLKKDLDRESAAREVLVFILVSPHFLFKAETLPPIAEAKTTEVPLNAHELASRLSYFLWASTPDRELRKAADDGSLMKPEVLAAHTQRMLRDPKASALAKEFAGQWLKFNGFDAHNSVDEKKFQQFTTELRADMHREVVEFFTHLVRDDRNVSDIISGDYTFMNERLGWHYGVPGIVGNDFREVKVGQHHRGGLLGMGAILTKTSRPHRTSPVVRGDYLYQVVLGFSSPPPPPNVPELKETSKPSSLREALMQHRTDSACAVCHERIDPLGFALESYDPIGRFRPTDEAGGKIDDTGEMMDGTKFQGLAGLRDYLKKNEPQFLTQFTRKLLGYALGRQTLPSDKKLLQQMQASLKAQNGHFSAAVLEIVKSRQFLNRRAEATVATNP